MDDTPSIYPGGPTQRDMASGPARRVRRRWPRSAGRFEERRARADKRRRSVVHRRNALIVVGLGLALGLLSGYFAALAPRDVPEATPGLIEQESATSPLEKERRMILDEL